MLLLSVNHRSSRLRSRRRGYHTGTRSGLLFLRSFHLTTRSLCFHTSQDRIIVRFLPSCRPLCCTWRRGWLTWSCNIGVRGTSLPSRLQHVTSCRFHGALDAYDGYASVPLGQVPHFFLAEFCSWSGRVARVERVSDGEGSFRASSRAAAGLPLWLILKGPAPTRSNFASFN